MTTHALMELADCICGKEVDQEECPYPLHAPTSGERALYVVNCIDPNCGWQAIGWGVDGARKAWNTRPQLRTAAAEGGDAPVCFASHKALRELVCRPPVLDNTQTRLSVSLKESGDRTIALYVGPPTDSGAALWWNGVSDDGAAIGPTVSTTKTQWHDIPLYRHADSGAGRDGDDAERWRTLRDSMPSEYNGEKGYIRWYLPRERGGFMSLQDHIDRLISIKSAHTAAIPGAAGEKDCA